MTLKQVQQMSQRELMNWMRFAAQRGLPYRRLEVQLARVALTVAQCAGNQNMTLDDFMLEKPETKKVKTEEAAMAFDALAGGVGVRKLGQGRKKK